MKFLSENHLNGCQIFFCTSLVVTLWIITKANGSTGSENSQEPSAYSVILDCAGKCWADEDQQCQAQQTLPCVPLHGAATRHI